ncbi:hypothetical protein J5N97_025306 [Dioscorea zingiberensis]|uniref:arginine--tRNA ligase n=1 Tax=Dioscorea zingiberensis TaxID=325984 RepID=A0A9D5H9I7_9LILI|nr:hypothetical protein J5N97_025306 [Dioscorea zingiberensis]
MAMSSEAQAPVAAAPQEQAPNVIAQNGNRTGSVKQQLSRLFETSLRATFAEDLNIEPMVAACTANFGDYQCNNAMGIWAKIKKTTREFRNPNSVGQAIVENLPPSEMIESTSVAGPGFVNIGLSNQWIAQTIHNMLSNGIGTWAPLLPVSRALVDFSSPNIAKEMHVGHLRSTIIGDTLARMLEFSNVDVLRRNHVGDWGTQFGMLIQHLFENFPNWEDVGEQAIGDLQEFYKASKKRYRLNVEKAEWIIYVTDVGQSLHFTMLFSAAKRTGWLPDPKIKAFPKTNHVGFCLVLGSDGKRFRTRSYEVVRLLELLDEAKNRNKAELLKRLEENGKLGEWTDEELEKTAEAVGYGAVKYADLKNNRLTNYTFSFDQMLNDKGNTAVYLLYAHARICSIIRKSGKDIEDLKRTGTIVLGHADERTLSIHLIRFAEIVEEACTNLLPNVLCEYLYDLSDKFSGFYTSCQVVRTPEETSRLLLCEATAVVMRKCFYLLGIEPVYKI